MRRAPVSPLAGRAPPRAAIGRARFEGSLAARLRLAEAARLALRSFLDVGWGARAGWRLCQEKEGREGRGEERRRRQEGPRRGYGAGA